MEDLIALIVEYSPSEYHITVCAKASDKCPNPAMEIKVLCYGGEWTYARE